MPPTLRRFVLESVLARPSLQCRYFSTDDSTEVFSTSIPISYIPTPSNDPQQRAIPSTPAAAAALEASTELFTSQRPRFLYSAPRFLHVPMNSHMPARSRILGRSNVGKSTLINALSGKSTSVAGRIHGNASKRAGLAMTSTKAGCTTALNAYGFGPPMKVPPQGKEDTRRAAARERSSGFGLSRTEKRAGRKRKAVPGHSLVMVDMPGYGLNSKVEWGTEIAKYLARRAMLRGALLLVDAVAGFKDGDRMALGLLRDANVRTTVILTKADKLGYGIGPSDAEVRKTCLSVLDELGSAGQKSLAWTQGQGWDPGDLDHLERGIQRHGGIGVEGARFAICRMAGLVEDGRQPAAPGTILGGSKEQQNHLL